ncbi:hypothetical protein [Acinetobacter sp. YH16031]|uniref:hypothetical protein n=1 Tax=Acinetobacter sp. YH16031 TaxID=2601180 RepID=UPI0015D15BC9|nr:hypothetical protein [Acinetobacter sp. YH16031]
MPKFTVAELAKQYGIARTSIYDRMKNGSISYEIDAKNRKVIDFSEMQRVYGTPDSKAYSTNEQVRTTTDLQEIVQPPQVTPIENKPIQQAATITPEPKKRGLFGRLAKAVFDN